MFHDADQVVPRLWLGNFNSSHNVKFLANKGVNVIINCTKDLPFVPYGGIYKYRVPVHDDLTLNEIKAMGYHLKHVIPIIEQHYMRGDVILVHCAAGIQRSAMVVLAFLCIHFEMDPKIALQFIRKKRPIIFRPFMNFAHSFKMLMGDFSYYQLIS